jgi:hypothetical protein
VVPDMIQLLCGTVNVWDEDKAGIKTRRAHALQVAEGVCACADPVTWAERTADMPRYYAGIQGDADWPVHVWFEEMPAKAALSGPPTDKAIKAEKTPGPCSEPACPACGSGPVDVRSFARRKPEPPPRGPHPAPVHVSTDPDRPEIPSAVQALGAKVVSQGWRVNVTYARGNGIHAAHGTPTKVVDSWALRCSYGPYRAVAVCQDGTWGSMWGVAHMFHARTQAQWLDYLNECAFGDVDTWLIAARAENEAKAKEKPCTDEDAHPAHTWGEHLKCKGRETAKVKRTREHGS